MNLSELKGPLLTAETQNIHVPECATSDEKLNRQGMSGLAASSSDNIAQ